MRKLVILALIGGLLAGCASMGADVQGSNKGARVGAHGTIFKF